MADSASGRKREGVRDRKTDGERKGGPERVGERRSWGKWNAGWRGEANTQGFVLKARLWGGCDRR